MSRRRFAVTLLVAAQAACTDEPDTVVLPGILNHTLTPNVVIPSTARIGEPIAVRVVTLGGGCRQFDSTTVTLSADVATVTPFDRYRIEGVCTLELRPIYHDATIQFDSPGVKSVHVIARSSESAERADVDVQQPLTVE